ncbi:AAA family ATPase [Rothia mucilaginosa]|uniref:AAA family ATPase n=1 Tax=Rothia mucilaginosa TaxID=43675 RepID=UPI0028EE6BEE|nr:AAA family ATPase [Rothia mucilaginosa]
MVSRNRIRKIEVQGVIDRYDYIIDFTKGDARIKAIYAENGHGKTNMLRALKALASNNLEDFKQILHLPFGAINIKTDNGQVSCVKKSSRSCSIHTKRIIDENSGNLFIVDNICDIEITLDDINRELEDDEEMPNEISDFMKKYRGISMEIHKIIGNVVFLDSNRLQNKRLLHNINNHLYMYNISQGHRKNAEEYSYNQDISGENVEGVLQALAFSLKNEARRINLGDGRHIRDVYYNIVRKIINDGNDVHSVEYSNPEDAIRSKARKIRESIEKINSYGLINSREFTKIDIAIKNLPEGDKSVFENLRGVLIPYLDNLSSQIESYSVIADLIDVFLNAANTMLNGVNLKFNEKNYGNFSIHFLYGEFSSQRMGLEDIKLPRGEKAIKLSSGEKHLLILLSVLTMCSLNSTSLLLIDEPEISLGIPWQRTLRKYMKRLVGEQGAQIVFATHSPVILDGYNRENIVFDNISENYLI